MNKKRLCAICLLLMMMVSFVACDSGKSGTDPTSQEATEESVNYVSIETPYAVLEVTEDFDKAVKSSVKQENPYVLDFITVEDKTTVFSLHFNDETKNLLGTLQLDDQNVVIYADVPELDKKSKNYKTNVGYQLQIGEIIDRLTKKYSFVPNEIITDVDEDVFAIETKLTTLYYPKKWEKKVTVTQKGNVVSFSAGKTKLFDLYFEEADGVLLGTYKDTPIYIVEHEAKNDEQAAMIQDVNVIISHLNEDENFSQS